MKKIRYSKGFVFCLLTIFIGCSNQQNKEKTALANIDSVNANIEIQEKVIKDSIYLDTNVVSKFSSNPFDNFISIYSDSIENLNPGEKLPTFIFNPAFDMEHPSYWPSLHSPISLRNEIIKHISTCTKLNLILNNKDIRLDKKPIDLSKNYSLIEMLQLNDKSFRELTILRLNELDCK